MGTLNAIDLNKGEIAWKVPLGELPELVKRGRPKTGAENYGGPIVHGRRPDLHRRHEGREVPRVRQAHRDRCCGETSLPAGGYATPATYSVGGKQCVVIAAGGGKMGTKSGDAYVALAAADTDAVPGAESKCHVRSVLRPELVLQCTQAPHRMSCTGTTRHPARSGCHQRSSPLNLASRRSQSERADRARGRADRPLVSLSARGPSCRSTRRSRRSTWRSRCSTCRSRCSRRRSIRSSLPRGPATADAAGTASRPASVSAPSVVVLTSIAISPRA
mgnify:CR=1 FL=1